MAIKGSLKEASLPDVLQLLAMGKKTGCLSVTHRNNFGYIYFEKGRIAYASIVNRRDRLGDLLIKAGLITRDQLDQAIGSQPGYKDKRLGDILVAQGLVSRDELHAQVRVQIQEAVYFLFTWSQGTFNFEADIRPEEQDFVVSINPESLLLEGARRVDEWGLISKKIPSFDLVFELDGDRIRQSDVTLTHQQEVLIDCIDGQRDVTALVDASGLSEFDVGKALFALTSAGFLHRVGTSKAEPMVSDARVEEHRNLGIAFYKTGMLEEAVREFRRVTECRPADQGAPFYLGLVLMRQGKWPAAADVYRAAAQAPGTKPAVFCNLAYILERLGEYDEARAALDEAVKRGAGNLPQVRTSYGALALRAGDIAEADAVLSAARALWGKRPPPPAWFHYAGLAAALAGDLDRATELLTEGTTMHPHAAALFNNLAAVAERRGGWADAAMFVERGTAEDPALPQLHKNSGDYAYRSGQYDEALDAYQRATRLNPALGDDVFFKIGNIRYRRRETAEAVKCWERALELEPANAIIRSNLDAVRRAG